MDSPGFDICFGESSFINALRVLDMVSDSHNLPRWFLIPTNGHPYNMGVKFHDFARGSQKCKIKDHRTHIEEINR